jgi:uncharacterized protein
MNLEKGGFPKDAPEAFHVLAKPAGANCNLNCRYCFFLAKKNLYPGSDFRMPDDVLETYIRQLLESHRAPDVTIAWQGGEPTLLGLEFFQRAVELANRYKRPDQSIQHTIQTNGALLDDNWCAFFKENRFLVGLSFDGPRDLHDRYRVSQTGAGTFETALQAWECLSRHTVEVNILCALSAANQNHPLAVYRFFRDELGARYLQFIPVVERGTGQRLVTAESVLPEAYGRFLISVFDEWASRDVGKVFVQHFDSALASWLGVPGSTCVFAETCGAALVLEHNGDLYSCDHFVDPAHKLGNIMEAPLIELAASAAQLKFGREKRDGLPSCCRSCPVGFACHGECPRGRFLKSAEGEPGLNYLCAGYKAFFQHIDKPMRRMAELLCQGRFADEIMRL